MTSPMTHAHSRGVYYGFENMQLDTDVQPKSKLGVGNMQLKSDIADAETYSG